MNLIVDIGNSSAKATLMAGDQIVDRRRFEELTPAVLSSLLDEIGEVEGGILCSLKEVDEQFEQVFAERVNRYMRFTHQTPIPIRNGYQTPQTLGLDRLAAAVGAATLFPGSSLMVVDFGTAITIDFVSADGEFMGGNISAGASTRLKALNHYTSALPLFSIDEYEQREQLSQEQMFGRTTQDAILKGVVEGIIFEIEGYISRFSKKDTCFQTIFTGGDSIFFAKRIKNTIFVTYDLIAIGLNRILESNV